MSPEYTHLAISIVSAVATVAFTAGSVHAIIRGLSRALRDHIASDDKRHHEHSTLLQEHDREIVRIGARLEVTPTPRNGGE